jgi:nicotinate-nucleotide adenylyltransferase
VQLALSGEERMEASDIEIRRGGKSYKLLTLQQYRQRWPEASLSIIVGSDMLDDLPNWYHAEEVLALASVLCVPRIGRNENDAETAVMLAGRYGAQVSLLSAKADMISSTEIRKDFPAVAREGWMPEAVEQAVYEGGEYFPEELRALQQKCRAALDGKRYRHVCGTMRASARLAQLWKQDAGKARLAALLHDCAKCLGPLRQEVLSGDESGIAPVHHAFAGAVLAKTEYGVSDETILRAIRLHTTGDWGMTDFEALIYTADLVEPTRTYSGVEEYRARLTADVEPTCSIPAKSGAAAWAKGTADASRYGAGDRLVQRENAETRAGFVAKEKQLEITKKNNTKAEKKSGKKTIVRKFH